VSYLADHRRPLPICTVSRTSVTLHEAANGVDTSVNVVAFRDRTLLHCSQTLRSSLQHYMLDFLRRAEPGRSFRDTVRTFSCFDTCT